MRGITFKGNREAEIQEFPDPHAGPGDAVLRVKASGLCGTDLHRYRGATPTVMITGHEPCGVIEELGPGAPPGLKLGDRVMCHHYAVLRRLRNLRHGLRAVVSQWPHHLWWRHRPRSQRRLHPGPFPDVGTSARRIVL